MPKDAVGKFLADCKDLSVFLDDVHKKVWIILSSNNKMLTIYLLFRYVQRFENLKPYMYIAHLCKMKA